MRKWQSKRTNDATITSEVKTVCYALFRPHVGNDMCFVFAWTVASYHQLDCGSHVLKSHVLQLHVGAHYLFVGFANHTTVE